MPVHTLIRIDTRTIADDRREIRAFTNVRNEILRLPRFFQHYRSIGVARFFVTDNGSTDGSKEFLLAQPDCHVFVTSNSYAESMYGAEWQNALLNEYGVDRWCLLVDADEWLVYPGYERKSILDLAVYLDQTNVQGMFSFLLDMYGPGPIAESVAVPERSSFDDCRYFDSQYSWHRRFYIPGIEPPRFPEYNVVGGPRLRLFYPNLRRYYYLIRAAWRARDWLRYPLPAALKPPPALTKVPLVRWLPGTRFRDSHRTTPINLSDVTGVLLHFKFLRDFYERISTEASRKEHWDGAAEHARYLAKLKVDPSLSLYYAGSVEYQGSEQLLRLGLLREDQGWRQVRRPL
jgi:hypothetical protein